MPHQLSRVQDTSVEYYCYARDSGDRVYIVIDDELVTLNLDHGGLALKDTPPSVMGLLPFYYRVKDHIDTRAFGFFPMQDSSDSNSETLIPVLTRWLDALKCPSGTRVFFCLDVFFGADSNRPLGVQLAKDLLVAMAAKPHLLARYCFLSKAGGEDPKGETVPGIAKELKDLIDRGWIAISKAFLHQGGGSSPLLLDFLGLKELREPDSTVALSASDWIALRRSAWALCNDRFTACGKDKLSPFNGHDWIHHLPFGGEPYVNQQHLEYAAREFRELCARLRETWPSTRAFPDLSWDIGCGLAPAPPYLRPPIRALAQFDAGGLDLSTAFLLAAEAMRDRMGQADAWLTVYVRGALGTTNELSEDYLWFNVGPLLAGMSALAEEFCGYCTDVTNSKKARDLLKVDGAQLPIRGEMIWLIEEERFAAGGGALRVEISEWLYPNWTTAPKSGVPNLSIGKILCRLKEDMSSRKTKGAFAPMGQSGARLAFSRDGRLEITVRARIPEWSPAGANIWEVDV
jgi:hypothetical protein